MFCFLRQMIDDPFKGIAAEQFSQEVVEVLASPLKTGDIEIKLDGIVPVECNLYCSRGVIQQCTPGDLVVQVGSCGKLGRTPSYDCLSIYSYGFLVANGCTLTLLIINVLELLLSLLQVWCICLKSSTVVS